MGAKGNRISYCVLFAAKYSEYLAVKRRMLAAGTEKFQKCMF